jgi:hypothetical protein
VGTGRPDRELSRARGLVTTRLRTQMKRSADFVSLWDLPGNGAILATQDDRQ